MHALLLLSFLLLDPDNDSNGAHPWGGGWIAHADHGVSNPGAPARNGGGGSSPWSDCHSITGANGVTYVQCNNGPNGQSNQFEAVVPGDPAAPVITPEMLLVEALRLLKPPAPDIETAPPRGKDGLVGLRHFVWADRAQWHSISKRATAGSVWAEVTAVPTVITIDPGSSQKSVTCQGPATPYDSKKSPDQQKGDCVLLFKRSSAGLPSDEYQVTVSVRWAASWRGSGGTGGTLAPVTTSTTFPVRVAEGQALIQRSS